MPLLASPRTDPDVPNSGIRLLPWVFDGETLARPGVKDLGSGEIVVGQLLDPVPGRVVLLAAVPERAPPEVDDMIPEGRQCPAVGGHGMGLFRNLDDAGRQNGVGCAHDR